ncbi:uncharacterized protein F5147DRAFT_769761 [Suillus discolor]|uniref:Uncharacterized protein n=1 Tax=Suillus discolor TaxID=1912936 RepID=A0A9P7FG36_9AGAM|nr:uncharacterized protein F5147DRAFT_769761 [Suillus discolor]KAG2115305.1 hypothetical protein F5147DRAFT_769761 [Suillus discolor]
MSLSEHAHKALNLVGDKIQWIIKKYEKLPMGDSGARTLAHEIAVTLSSAFAQHRHATISVLPMLLSCAAELWDKSAPNGKLKGLPDWSTILDDNTCICSHLLFGKTIRYRRPDPPVSPPLVTAPLPTPPTPAIAPAALASNSTHAAVASTLFPIPAPPPPEPTAKWFNLVVPGNKHKALTSELEDDVEEPMPRLAKWPMSKSWHERVKLKRIISDDEDDEVLPMEVIFMKNKNQTVNNASPMVVPPVAAKPGVGTSKMTISSEHLFSDKCEVWKCCRTCDEKKTKCIQLDSDVAELLHGHITLKKVKAATASEKDIKTCCGLESKWFIGPPGEHAIHATLRARQASPVPRMASNTEDSANEDAEGDNDPQSDVLKATAAPIDVVPEVVAPAAPINNDVNMSLAPGNDALMGITVPDALQVPHPTLFDAIWTIEALGTRFEGMVTCSNDRTEALHEDMVGWMSTLDEEWNRRFATMEAKIWDVKLKNSGNMASIGHMANAMSMFHQTRMPSSFDPPTGPLMQGYLFGQIPSSWFPNAPELAV